MKKYCCFCCFGGETLRTDTDYEEIQIASSGDEGGECGWSLNLLGSTNSSSSTTTSDEDVDEMNIVMNASTTTEEKSVDDEQYYRLYRPNLHRREAAQQEQQPRSRSTAKTIELIETAHAKLTHCFVTMKRTDYEAILSVYEEALECCPLRHKYKVIKEYETFKHMCVTLVKDTDDYRAALCTAYAQWQLATNATQNTKHLYRRAIMCMPDQTIKSEWKREYNVFLKKYRLSKAVTVTL